MRIIGGLDDAYTGDLTWAPGYKVGYLSQEPQLDESKTVREIVEEGTQEIIDVLREYEEINAKFGEDEILNDPDKILWTYSHILPNFLSEATEHILFDHVA